MKEISNSTLALLVVVAIVVSVFGILISLSKMSQQGAGGITGMFTSQLTGSANLTVPSTASIKWVAGNGDVNSTSINLGNVFPNATNTSDTANDFWTIENDGSVKVAIRISSSPFNQGGLASGVYTNSTGYGPFLSNTSIATGCVNPTTLNHTCFMVKCNSTQSGIGCGNAYYPLGNETVTSARLFVDDLEAGDDRDEVAFGVNVTVPLGEPSGQKIQYVTINAADSS